jgi:hypothetical protein
MVQNIPEFRDIPAHAVGVSNQHDAIIDFHETIRFPVVPIIALSLLGCLFPEKRDIYLFTNQTTCTNIKFSPFAKGRGREADKNTKRLKLNQEKPAKNTGTNRDYLT